MIDKIVFLVPTRGRPENVNRLAKAFSQCETGFADLVFVVDGDHDEEHDYSRASLGYPVYFQPWRGLCATLNIQGLELAKRYKYVGFMGDDHVPRELGFDHLLYSGLFSVGSYSIAYGPDGQADIGDYLGYVTQFTPHVPMTWWAMDSEIITMLGQMVPWVLNHTCCDDYVFQLGYQSETLWYDSEALIEHLHPLWNKAETDDSYELSSYHHNRLADHRKWQEYQKVQLQQDVRLIRAARKAGK